MKYNIAVLLREYYEMQGKKSSLNTYIGSWNIKNAMFKHRHEVIKAMIPKGKGIALDVGCGLGIYSLDIFKSGYEVISLDISKSYLEKVKKLKGDYISDWHLIIADAQNIPFRINSIDLILIVEVLEHLPFFLKALINIVKILKIGGILVISIPSAYSLDEVFLSLSSWEHLHKISPTMLRNFLQANGFIKIEERYFNFMGYLLSVLPRLKLHFLEYLSLLYWRKIDQIIGMIPLLKLFCWNYAGKYLKIK
ncbi:MAG: methyltransferase domain-containing protein [Thermofilum sp.]|nr:methyltransferase domain-containing protein [Thermofilum sp.]